MFPPINGYLSLVCVDYWTGIKIAGETSKNFSQLKTLTKLFCTKFPNQFILSENKQKLNFGSQWVLNKKLRNLEPKKKMNQKYLFAVKFVGLSIQSNSIRMLIIMGPSGLSEPAHRKVPLLALFSFSFSNATLLKHFQDT